MATVPGSRSGAGGKIVANRRKQRLAATPYDRPPPPRPPQKSPNWFTGVVIPSARALASGAGKFLLSAIVSDSESSSSEDEEYGSEDDVDNVNEYENAYDGDNTLNEVKATLSEMTQNGHESLFSPQRTETKQIIEQLIMQETFSREERDRLEKILNSRVMDESVEARQERTLANSPGETVEYEDIDIFNKAVLEAKKWFQEKKGGSNSVTKLADRTRNFNSTGLEHEESGVGSPVDVARSYMRDRPPWASPTEVVELRTPLTTTMKLFNEGTPYSVSYDSLSSKRRNSLASGSWNIQEELRRVRSKATENMLRTPPAKSDPSLFAIAQSRWDSAGAVKVVSDMGEVADLSSKIKPIDTLMDVGVSSDPALVALESRQVAKDIEEPFSNPVASVSENNKDSETIHLDGECAPSKVPHPTSPNHAGEHQSDTHSSKMNGPPAAVAAEFGGRQYENGFTSSQASLSTGVATAQNDQQYDEETQSEHTVSEKKSTNSINVEGKCELLSEAYMEVPIVTETGSIASGPQNGLSKQYEEVTVEMTQPSTKGKADIVIGKQQGRKPTTRRSRGRGK
ncbi:hypothetical protein BUALT_Bualt05G0028700 [Buddleja alternifolia]|uniref:Protein KAKU4 n=1 Tax=Buddleja alternifolia TaxID=168488 RepID=A0AAV6XHP4_9LAMI|nr:hypothetical protein BUALT_Bualt05G0028700 [Buddleja alternifolia]